MRPPLIAASFRVKRPAIFGPRKPSPWRAEAAAASLVGVVARQALGRNAWATAFTTHAGSAEAEIRSSLPVAPCGDGPHSIEATKGVSMWKKPSRDETPSLP